MQARISLRRQRKGGPPPSTDAICKWFEQNPNKRQDIGSADIRAALSSGEEVGLKHLSINLPPVTKIIFIKPEN
jgi:hypothetical protein